jgi:ATP-dependent DNA helicase RecQ
VPAEELSFKTAPYHQRKQLFIGRVEKMIAYAKSTGCRSRFINQYFGDSEAVSCGICDNCLAAASKEVSAEEFQKFSTIIFQSLQTSSRSSGELISELKGLRKEKAWKILEFLQAENKIVLDDNGQLRLK